MWLKLDNKFILLFMVLLFVSLTFGPNANLRKKIVTYSNFVYKELVVYAIASLH
jgi:hypothetical protein